MNDERDPLDETLARGLGALAPSEFELDADAALGSLRPGMRRARVRRRLAASTATLGVFALVVAGAVVAGHHPGAKVDVHEAAHPTVVTRVPALRSTTTRPLPTTTTTTPVVPPNPTQTTTATTQRPDPGAGPQPTPTPTSTRTPPATTTATTPDRRGTTTTTTVSAPSTKTYVAVGGHATIRYAGGRLMLVSYAPSAGYTTEMHTETATDIELRFSNGDHTSRIRVRVNDGRLRPEIDEN